LLTFHLIKIQNKHTNYNFTLYQIRLFQRLCLEIIQVEWFILAVQKLRGLVELWPIYIS